MKKFFLILLSAWIWISACNDPILVGSDLLDEEGLDVTFVDDVALGVATQLSDPTRTYTYLGTTSNYSVSTYIIGEMDDDVFGKSKATTYFTPSIIVTSAQIEFDRIDSVVLTIPLDTVGYNGNRAAVHDLELRVLDERIEMDIDSTLYSDVELSATELVASASKTLNPLDSLTITDYISNDPDSTVQIAPQLRMQLDKEMWREFLSDSLSQERLEETVPGFALSSSPSENSMVGLNLGFQASTRFPSNILFYYNLNDSVRSIYTLPVGRIRHSLFTNDYSGSELGESLGTANPEKVYLQSQGGTDIALDISGIRAFGDRILNSAVLNMTLELEDENIYDPVEAVFAWARDDDGELFIVGAPSDISNPIVETFPNGVSTSSYRIDLTNYLERVKRGEITSDSLFLIANTKSQRSTRSIILGPSHPINPLKIELILTKP